MNEEDSIKEEWDNERKGSRNEEKNTVASRSNFIIKPERNIEELISSDYAEDDFLQYKPVYFQSLMIWIHFSDCLIH